MLNPAVTVVIGQAILASLGILKVKIMPVKELLQKNNISYGRPYTGTQKCTNGSILGWGGGGEGGGLRKFAITRRTL